jgi:uncharacterized membrane protein
VAKVVEYYAGLTFLAQYFIFDVRGMNLLWSLWPFGVFIVLALILVVAYIDERM